MTLATPGHTTQHRDAQGTVRAVTAGQNIVGTPGDDRVLKTERRVYRPNGTSYPTFTLVGNLDAAVSKGWIGERYDADAGLQYLNARDYDPDLAMFLQPDWWEVTQAGVGTDRYAYAGSNPVNGVDPGGHFCSTPGPFAPTMNCSGGPGYNVLASTVNLFTSDLGNILSGPLVAAGTLAAPHEGALTNAAMTLPGAFDDVLAGVTFWSSRAAAARAITSSDAVAALTKGERVLINNATGKAGERTAGAWLEANGYTIVSSQQTVRTSQGARVYDFLVREPGTGRLINIEVKTDGATVSAMQRAKDAEVATDGGVYVGERARRLRDTNQVIPTANVQVDSATGCVTMCGPAGSNSVGIPSSSQINAYTGNGGLY